MTERNISDFLELEGERFVIALYEYLLGRFPDPEGMAYYLNRLSRGYSKASIADQIVRSPENKNNKKISGLGSLWSKASFLKPFSLVKIFKKNRCLPIVVGQHGAVDQDENFLNNGFSLSDLFLYSVENIVIYEFSAKRFRATNGDSQLFFKPAHGLLCPGLYELNILLDADFPVNSIFLYGLSVGDFRVIPDCIHVSAPVVSGETSRIYFYINQNIGGIRLDPCIRVQSFNILSVKVKRFSDGDIQSEDVFQAIRNLQKIYNQPGLIFDESQISNQSLAAFYEASARIAAKYACDNFDYLNYIHITKKDLNVAKMTGVDKNTRPVFSVVMPVYNTPKDYLEKAISSVLSSTFDDFEIVLADDNSTDENIISILENFKGKDSRVKVVYLKENGGISKATNAALEKSKGQYICFMDHDDLLDKNALSVYYKEILKFRKNKKEILCIYCDEDKIDEFDNHFDPFFKPSFNKSRFLCHNYITHFVCVNKEALSDHLYLRSDFDGAQDYDFLLRILPELNRENCIRIPQVLYSWRAHSGSTALSSSAKSYSTDCGKNALVEYFDREHISAQVNEVVPNVYEVIYKTNNQSVDIIIPFKDHVDITRKCVESILAKTKYKNFKITLINNNSAQKSTLDYMESMANLSEKIRVLDYPKQFNWSAINNFAAKQSKSDIFLFLNNDMEIIDGDWLDRLVGQVSQDGVGCVGCMLLYPDYTIQHGGVLVGMGGLAGHQYINAPYDFPGEKNELLCSRDITAVTGACIMIKSNVFFESGGFDESFMVAFNDIEFCVRVYDSGYRNIFMPSPRILHYESKSRGYEDTPEKVRRFDSEKKRMMALWPSYIQDDPCFNPNLDKGVHNPQIDLNRLVYR